MAIARAPVRPEIQDLASARPIPIRCESDSQDRFSIERPALDGPRFFGMAQYLPLDGHRRCNAFLLLWVRLEHAARRGPIEDELFPIQTDQKG